MYIYIFRISIYSIQTEYYNDVKIFKYKPIFIFALILQSKVSLQS